MIIISPVKVDQDEQMSNQLVADLEMLIEINS